MKLIFVTAILGLLSLVASGVLPLDLDHTTLLNLTNHQDDFTENRVHLTARDDALWNRATCRGAKLLLCTTLNPDQASQHCNPINSPWQGTLENELAAWGYADDSENPRRRDDCDFRIIGDLENAFQELGIDQRNHREGGPNRCFTIVHYSGPAVERNRDGSMPPLSNQYYTVNGRRYRITGALFTIGINAQDGVIYFIQRESPEHEAHELWGVPREFPIPRDQLPALRSSSDIAWGLWNRMSGHNLGNIRAFMSMTIVNEDTGTIIEKALEKVGIDEVPAWPGHTFNSGSEEYSAILGSPNGLAVGYFLAQHKAQIGGNKYISQIVVFREEDESSWPYLLFYVDWAPNPPPPPPAGASQEGHMEGEADYVKQESWDQHESMKVLNKTSDGKNVVREHVIRAKS